MKSLLKSLAAFFRYNASAAFTGKFIYFLVLAVVVFLATVVIYVAGHDLAPTPRNVYYFLLIPAVLLVFYPSAYCIQADQDARMLETLFGIPDYRFNVWLARGVTQYIVIAGLLFVLALLCRIAISEFPILSMVFHLMFPVVFLGGFGFTAAVLTRSGNSTAVIMVLLLLATWLSTGVLEGTSWNLFHNPFMRSEELSMTLTSEITLYNRVYLLVGAVVTTMFALLRLRKRENFF